MKKRREDEGREKEKKKRNISRLGGTALSLQAFANAKSTSSHYNPALLKRKREFYKNAKYVSKFKRKLKQQTQQNDTSTATISQASQVVNEITKSNQVTRKDKKNKESYRLQELYEKQREDKEKARIEEEAILKAKKEEREKAEARRKAAREKMFKRTQHGQPVMKYRIEHLLHSIQNSK